MRTGKRRGPTEEVRQELQPWGRPTALPSMATEPDRRLRRKAGEKELLVYVGGMDVSKDADYESDSAFLRVQRDDFGVQLGGRTTAGRGGRCSRRKLAQLSGLSASDSDMKLW